jgi:uncharacterized protein (TIGR03790 family)
MMVSGSTWSNVFVALILCAPIFADDLAQRVVIVYNQNQPEGKSLAEYYAAKRGVPTNQICAIKTRIDETITRREFNETVREPVLRFLTRSGLLIQQPVMIEDPVLGRIPSVQTATSKISYVVLIYGVPLRIDSDPNIVEKAYAERFQKELRRNEAAVDSELATLPTPGAPITGPLPNPFYNNPALHFEAPQNNQMLLVCRLDAGDAATVRRMIDDALTAERYGLYGRCFFDAQGTRDKGYEMGDEWIKNSHELFRRAGFDCDYDDRKEIFGEEYPMIDAAVYAGWYRDGVAGPFRRNDFRFQTGALAYHIHSTSAASLHKPLGHWAAPLLDKGAAATMGNVFEPYLQLTPNVDKFFKRILDGGIFIEAAYFSQRVISWQTTFVGDPLYRPFAVPLDERIARLEADNRPELSWAYVRKINLMFAAGQTKQAETLCRKKSQELDSLVLREKLANILGKIDRRAEAISLYRDILTKASDPHSRVRLTMRLADAYAANRQPKLALAQYEQLTAMMVRDKDALEYYKKARDLAAAIGDTDKTKRLQLKIDSLSTAK